MTYQYFGELVLGILNNNSIYLLHGHIVVRLIKISEELQKVFLCLGVKGGRLTSFFCIIIRIISSNNGIPCISRHKKTK